MQSTDYDVAILGAGAAGLFAAIRAAERGRRVILIEKNRRPGVKILMSGGTRCNLTNARGLRDLDAVSGGIDPAYRAVDRPGPRWIQEAFGSNGRFLGPALRALDVDQTVRFFEGEGVATKVEANGKIFPQSDRAVDVLDALIRRLERSAATLRTNGPAQSVEADHNGFLVHIADGPVSAARVIVASGGHSYPGCGTTGDGYAIARAFGHSIVEPRPALVPLRVDSAWAADLKGITLPDVIARVVAPEGTRIERRESVLFAHFGLTGPAILDVSRAVARASDSERLVLTLDLAPEQASEQIDRELQTATRSGKKQVVGLLPAPLPRRLAEVVLRLAAVPADRIGPELSKLERRALVETIKRCALPIAGTLGFGKAEVTSGGVALDEIDPETAESRRQPGLHFIGEVLDLDGWIGGYNFQAAWSLGWMAGGIV